ncbi:MAG: hypothetical protein ABL921_10185 [Pirellula sp.]
MLQPYSDFFASGSVRIESPDSIDFQAVTDTLDPLREFEFDALALGDIEGVRSVRMVELWLGDPDSRYGVITIRKGDDPFDPPSDSGGACPVHFVRLFNSLRSPQIGATWIRQKTIRLMNALHLW